MQVTAGRGSNSCPLIGPRQHIAARTGSSRIDSSQVYILPLGCRHAFIVWRLVTPLESRLELEDADRGRFLRSIELSHAHRRLHSASERGYYLAPDSGLAPALSLYTRWS